MSQLPDYPPRLFIKVRSFVNEGSRDLDSVRSPEVKIIGLDREFAFTELPMESSHHKPHAFDSGTMDILGKANAVTLGQL